MRRVAAYFFGGTISVRAEPVSDAAPGRLTAGELLAGLDVPGVEVVAEQVRAVGSSRLGFDDVLTVVRRARQVCSEGGVDGVVVVQGTDTLQEVAFLVDLVWDLDAPVVLTGAMRQPGHRGADGPANLEAAIRTAADPQAQGAGALVAMADTIHAARLVSKAHASLPHAFASPDGGPVGTLVEGRPRFVARPLRHEPLPVPRSIPRDVAVHLCTLDEDPQLLRAAAAPAQGLVVAAFGVGHVRPETADVLQEVAERIPVVLCSQNAAGSVHTRTYRGPGSESDLLGRGLVNGGALRPAQARLLLATLLGLGATGRDVDAAFAARAQ